MSTLYDTENAAAKRTGECGKLKTLRSCTEALSGEVWHLKLGEVLCRIPLRRRNQHVSGGQLI